MLLPLALFMFGLFSLDHYKNVLIRAELEALQRQGIVLARSLALAEAGEANLVQRRLSNDTMRQLLPLVGYGSVLRARVFQPNGALAADTARDGLSSGAVRLRLRRDRGMQDEFGDRVLRALNAMTSLFSGRQPMPIYRDRGLRHAADFPDVELALQGQVRRNVFVNRRGQMVLSVAIPVQDLRVIRGALLLTTSGSRISSEIRDVQWTFLQLFGLVTLVTIGLALYLSRSITAPIAKLAQAAHKLRQSHDMKPLATLPERKDEIGALSVALGDMTNELQRRIQATAGFAADVSHELKNPLTSLRSAVETVSRIEDPAQQRKLMDIILADVARLDRLITDIAQASRIDVELHKALPQPTAIKNLLDNWLHISRERHPNIVIEYDCHNDDVAVRMFEGRIVQILDNLLQNAISFSPESGVITVRLKADKAWVRVMIEDEGPGIPEAKKEAIFDRFYTERPDGEAFGNHSGLGLSISRQIAEAHNGTLIAENKKQNGARFILSLPVAPLQRKSPDAFRDIS